MGKHKASEQDGEYPCQYLGCKRIYKSKFSLRRHYLAHLNARHHRCPYCHKGFALAQYLREHIHIHTGAKPFVCPYPGCGKQFRQAGKLSIHRKEHSNCFPILPHEEPSYSNDALNNLYAVRAVFEELKSLTIPSFFYTKVLPVPQVVRENPKMVETLREEYLKHQEKSMHPSTAPPSPTSPSPRTFSVLETSLSSLS